MKKARVRAEKPLLIAVDGIDQAAVLAEARGEDAGELAARIDANATAAFALL